MNTSEVGTSGNQFIDDNHSCLLNFMNALVDMVKTDWDEDKFSAGVLTFVNSLENHFQHEEIILRGAEFEDLDTHTLKHREIALKIRKEALSGFDYDRAIDFLGRIQTKVFSHELFEDQSYWPSFENDSEKTTLLIEWSEELETGDPEADRHHRALVNFINRLDKTLISRPEAKIVSAELQNLAAYSELHFREEETSLGKNLRLGHKDNHTLLLLSLNNLIKEVEAGDRDLKTIGDYLKYWFINHVKTFDIPAYENM